MGKITKALKALSLVASLYRVRDPRLILFKFPEYGKALLIYDYMKFAESDEYLYHESLVHPAMVTHGNPKDVLIIGGGDGLALREVLKWSSVESVDVVDNDNELINLGREKLKDLNSNAFSDRRVKVFLGYGREFLQRIWKKYDVIIIDTIDPEVDQIISWLFTKEFYLTAMQKLNPGGVLVTRGSECESLTFSRIYNTLASVFPVVRAYCVNIPSMGKVGFVIASNFQDPASITYFPSLQTKAYNSSFHMQLFSTQYDYHKREANIITDLNPIKQGYFFSAKLDDDERIVKVARVRVVIGGDEGGDVVENDYLAVTNKRYLLAKVEGVHSFTEAEPYNLYNIKRIFSYGITISAIVSATLGLITHSLLVFLTTFGVFALIVLGALLYAKFYQRNKITIKTNARYYISKFYRLLGQGRDVEIIQEKLVDEKVRKLAGEKLLGQGRDAKIIDVKIIDAEIIRRQIITFLKDQVTEEILSSAMHKRD